LPTDIALKRVGTTGGAAPEASRPKILARGDPRRRAGRGAVMTWTLRAINFLARVATLGHAHALIHKHMGGDGSDFNGRRARKKEGARFSARAKHPRLTAYCASATISTAETYKNRKIGKVQRKVFYLLEAGFPRPVPLTRSRTVMRRCSLHTPGTMSYVAKNLLAST
jgi:hypothetical protein